MQFNIQDIDIKKKSHGFATQTSQRIKDGICLLSHKNNTFFLLLGEPFYDIRICSLRM